MRPSKAWLVLVAAAGLLAPDASTVEVNWVEAGSADLPASVIVVNPGTSLAWMYPDGSGRHDVISGPYGPKSDPVYPVEGAISPSGNRIAFNEGGGDWAGGLKTVNLDGTGVRSLLPGGVYNQTEYPSWAPDGRHVLFNGERGMSTVNTVGAAVSSVVPGSAGLRWGHFNPVDGREIVASVGKTKEIVLLRGGVVHKVPGAFGDWPSLSPDGRWIAYSTSMYSSSATAAGSGIYIVNRDGTGRRQLTQAGPPGSADYQGSPTWSLDGKTIYFSICVNCDVGNGLFAVPADATPATAPARVGTFLSWWGRPMSISVARRDTTAPDSVRGLGLRLSSTTHPVLTWSYPIAEDFSHAVIERRSGTGPWTVAYSGRGRVFTDSKTVITKRSPNVVYRVTAVDGVGNSALPVSAQTTSRAAPLQAPDPASATSTGPTFTVRWAPTAPVNPADTRYRVWWRTRTATSATTWRLWLDGTASWARFGTNGRPTAPKPGVTYCFRVVTIDRYGRTSSPRYGRTAEPYDDSLVSYQGIWTSRHKLSGRWLGSLHLTREAGAKARLTRSGIRYYVIGDRTPMTGVLKIYLNGVYQASIDTGSTAGTVTVRSLLWRSPLMSSAKRTLTIVNAGTAGRPWLRIDAIAASS